MRISDWSSDVCSSDLVENERFGQGRDFGGRSDPAHRDAAACTLDIAHHLAEVAARFDVDRVILPEPLHREGVLVPAKRARGGREGRKLGLLGGAFGIGRQPAHAIIVADHDLKAAPAVIERRGELAPPLGRAEEHTSELQSLMRISYAVFCLNKKKKQTTQY